jgi:hypothetical protein
VDLFLAILLVSLWTCDSILLRAVKALKNGKIKEMYCGLERDDWLLVYGLALCYDYF